MATLTATKAAPRSPQAIKAELDARGLVEICKHHQTDLENARKDAHEEAGLCAKCGGFGGWEYRPTLDYMNEFAYQTCPDCDGVNRAQPIIEALDYPPEHLEDFAALEALQSEWTKSEKLANGDWQPARGSYWAGGLGDNSSRAQALKGLVVTVYRGRKIKIGTTGLCFWVGNSQYGERVGIRVEGQETPVWVDARNVRPVWAADEQ